MTVDAAVPVWLTVPQFSEDPRPAFQAASFVSSYRLAGVFCFDHLVPLDDPHRPVLELASLLGALAAIGRTRVGSLVMRAPLRGPHLSSAVAATAAAVTPGGFVLGLGVGDSRSREEARRYGQVVLPLDRRLALLEETIRLVRERAPSVPVWVGGTHRRVREAAVDWADGWNGWGLSPAEVAELAGGLRRRRSDLRLSWGGSVLLAGSEAELEELWGRRTRPPTVAGTPGRVVEHLGRLRRAGVDEFVVSVLPNRPDRWEMFAEQVVARLYR